MFWSRAVLSVGTASVARRTQGGLRGVVSLELGFQGIFPGQEADGQCPVRPSSPARASVHCQSLKVARQCDDTLLAPTAPAQLPW